MNATKPKKVLITFARSFLALDMARLWHTQGHQVFVADSLEFPLSRFSKAVSKSFIVPRPRFEPEKYVDAIVRIVEAEKIDLLLPIYEEAAYITAGIGRFPDFCKIFCPSFDLYERLQNKWMFQETLKALGVPTLKASLIASKEDLLHHNFDGPFALKPCYSRASQHVKKVIPGHALPNIIFEPHNPWIAQEWATGKKYCTYSICRDGEVRAHGTYPVNYAINGNSCVIFDAIAHQGIEEWISHFIQKINYSGQIAFDFIESDDGRLFAIECNPRTTSGLLLFNPDDRLDQAFLGTNPAKIYPQKGSRQQIALGMLMYGWRKSAKENNNLVDFMKILVRTKDVILRKSDLMPFIVEPLIFAQLWLKSRKQRLSMPDFFTYDHDWNGTPLNFATLANKL